MHRLFTNPVLAEVKLPAPREQMIADIESGKLDHIDFDAIVFTFGTNRNFFTFREEDLPEFAGSFHNQPFLVDHNWTEVSARQGTILSSQLEGKNFKQSIRLTTREGMLNLVEGRIDRFSISWMDFKDVLCSVCGNFWLSKDCSHWPGKTYSIDGKEILCELIFVEPKGRETSAVNSPAADGTHILSESVDSLLHEKAEITGQSLADIYDLPNTGQASICPKGDIMPKATPTDGQKPAEPVTQVESPNPTEAARLEQIEANRQAAASLMGESERLAELDAQVQESQKVLVSQCAYLLSSALASSKLPEVVQTRLRKQFDGRIFEATELDSAIQDAREEIAALTAPGAIQGPGRVTAMFNEADHIQLAMDDLLGAERDPDKANVQTHRLTGIREAYVMLTGDREFFGGVFPEFMQLATTANFPGIVKDSMNKLLVKHWAQYGKAGYNWWEKVVTVDHFTYMHEVDWVITGTIASLPEVEERADYGVLPIGDNVETSDWTKYGGYVPITLEAILRDDTHAFRTFPKEVALGGIRNVSEQVAAIFTANSGVGPTMADTGALFNATAVTTAGGHANLLTTALGTDYTAWNAAALAMYNQPMHVANSIEGEDYYGTGKKQAIWPSICLVPGALLAAAQALFVPRWAQVVESVATVGGPSFGGKVEPLAVPEWTDATDWAALIDPRLVPGIMIGEIFGVMPQIFVAGGEHMPAMFTNDESRIKVRQLLTVGVANWRAMHKSNVA